MLAIVAALELHDRPALAIIDQCTLEDNRAVLLMWYRDPDGCVNGACFRYLFFVNGILCDNKPALISNQFPLARVHLRSFVDSLGAHAALFTSVRI